MPNPQHGLAQGLPGCVAVPTSPDKPTVCLPLVFGQEQDSGELTVPRLSTAQPPSLPHRPRILTAASFHPQGTPVCQPMPMASTRSPQGCQPALPPSLSVVMVTRYVVTGEDGASHPSRAVCPAGLATPPSSSSPVTPGSRQGTLHEAPAPGSVLGVLHLLRCQNRSCVPSSSCEEWGQRHPPSICPDRAPPSQSQAMHRADKLISVMTNCLSSQGETLSLQGQPHLPTAAAAGTTEDEQHAALAHLHWAHPQDSCQAGHLSPNTPQYGDSVHRNHCLTRPFPAQYVSLLPQNSRTTAQAAHKAASPPGLWPPRASSNCQGWAHPQPY